MMMDPLDANREAKGVSKGQRLSLDTLTWETLLWKSRWKMDPESEICFDTVTLPPLQGFLDFDLDPSFCASERKMQSWT